MIAYRWFSDTVGGGIEVLSPDGKWSVYSTGPSVIDDVAHLRAQGVPERAPVEY